MVQLFGLSRLLCVIGVNEFAVARVFSFSFFFFFNDPAPPEIYTLSLHDALPICRRPRRPPRRGLPCPCTPEATTPSQAAPEVPGPALAAHMPRSEEHTSELQSHHDLVCRLLLEKKKQTNLLTFYELITVVTT